MGNYSGTPLSRKLGIGPGSRVKTCNAPDVYESLLAPLPEKVVISSRLHSPVHIFHLFAKSRSSLALGLTRGLRDIYQNGAIWVSWPKKASGIKTELTENVVRQMALPLSLVDVKVCSVDETWSGLKLVIRKELRK